MPPRSFSLSGLEAVKYRNINVSLLSTGKGDFHDILEVISWLRQGLVLAHSQTRKKAFAQESQGEQFVYPGTSEIRRLIAAGQPPRPGMAEQLLARKARRHENSSDAEAGQ